MQNPHRKSCGARRPNFPNTPRLSLRFAVIASICAALTVSSGFCVESSDPLLDLMLRKGLITEDEAQKVKAEADTIRTNGVPPLAESKWKLSPNLKNVELFGDVRVRYEDRSAQDPAGNSLDLQRFRYAVRVGLRGDVYDDFYYGFRLEEAANPRSPWLTLGTSSSGVPYQGPFGKSTAGIDIGQAYIGWRPGGWLDLTVGKMPNPLFTTPMVWDGDLNPEGAAERLKYSVGSADLFATFGQFLYQDVNPSSASGGLGINGLTGQKADSVFQIAWQAGLKYRFTTNTSAKMAATLYHYMGLRRSSLTSPGALSPFFGDPYIGEGASLLGLVPGSAPGYGGYGTSGTLPGYGSLGFPLNQVGLNHLLVLEVPFEVNFKVSKVDVRLFGDAAYNLEGRQRAGDAAAAYTAVLAQTPTATTHVSPFSPQIHDVKAYQIGVAMASKDSLGLVYGATSSRHAWELRTYWQHVEQYALDPNLLDSDFFEGRGNLEGIYASAAYGFTGNLIGTFRYGYASRINKQLGTGGSNQDIPQMNPIEHYNLLQLDLTFRF